METIASSHINNKALKFSFCSDYGLKLNKYEAGIDSND